jgi:hypothetical protein
MDMPETLDPSETQTPDHKLYLPFDQRAALASGAKE